MFTTTRDNFEKAFELMENLNEKMKNKQKSDAAFDFFPSEDDIEYIDKHMDKDMYAYVLFLVANAPDPKNEAEKNALKKLNEILKKNTQFSDEQ